MKKTVFFAMLCVCALAATGLTACSNNDDEGARDVLAAFNNSGCKPSGATDKTRSFVDELIDEHINQYLTKYITYESTADGYLTLQHVNAIFGCDAALTATAIAENNVITVTEKGLSEANCECPYDLTVKVGPLEAGDYKVVINTVTQENASPEELTSFTASHRAGAKGVHEVPTQLLPYEPTDLSDMPAWLAEWIKKDMTVVGGVVNQGSWSEDGYAYCVLRDGKDVEVTSKAGDVVYNVYTPYMSNYSGQNYNAAGELIRGVVIKDETFDMRREGIIDHITDWKCIYKNLH